MFSAGGRRKKAAGGVGGKQSRWPFPSFSTRNKNYWFLLFGVCSEQILIGIHMWICREFACGRQRQRKRKRQSIGWFPQNKTLKTPQPSNTWVITTSLFRLMSREPSSVTRELYPFIPMIPMLRYISPTDES